MKGDEIMEQKLLSIYVGNDVTRICELVKKSNTQIIVNNAAEVSTPSGAIDDGYIICLCDPDEACGNFANLRYAAGCSRDLF